MPPLPRHYLERSGILDQLKKLVLSDGSEKVGIVGQSTKVGVRGMGGVGKSVLAAALAYDKQVRSVFPDGAIWITVGHKPDISMLQAQLVEFFEDRLPIFLSPKHGKSYLSKLLGGKACLLILDDVWRIEHAEAFEIG